MKREENVMIIQSEHEANYFVARVMRIAAAALTLILVLNLTGVFVIKTVPMTISFVIGMLILLMPTVLVNAMKLEHYMLKYVFVTAAVLFVSIMIITLNWHAVVIYIFAIGIASMYFSPGVNRYAVILSIVCFSIAQYISGSLQLTEDRNQLDSYYIIVYCIVPRALSLFAMCEIFLCLNKRTTKQLRSLMDADTQTRMMNKMKKMQNKSLQISEILVTAVDTLTNVTENSSKLNKNIADGTSQAAAGSSETLAHIDEMGSNIKNISDNLVRLSGNTDDMYSISTEVKSLTEENTTNMDTLLREFNSLNTSTNNSMQIINSLDDKSKEIMNIIKVITSISSQTNLLALNASIESARAGEAGRGFAVVADEIRVLADQTRVAVGDISKIIQEVVSTTLEAVHAMEENSKSVNNSTDILKRTEESSAKVTRASVRMNERVEEIDTLTREVAKDSENIVNIVSNVEEISSKNLEELQLISDAGEESLRDMSKLVELVDNIRNLSAELNNIVRD